MGELIGPRRLLPISRLLLITIGLLVALSGGVVLLLLRSTSEHLLLDVGTRALLRTMDVIEIVVRGQLDPAQIQVESVGQLMSAENYDLSNATQIEDILQGALAATPQIRVLAYCDADLQFHVLLKDVDSNEVIIEKQDVSDDVLARSMNDMMRSTKVARWGELIEVETIDRTLLNVRYPIWRGEEYFGFLVAGVTTMEMSHVTESIQELMGVSTYLTLGQRQVLAHPSLTSQGISEQDADLFEQLTSVKNLQERVNIRNADVIDQADVLTLAESELESFDFELNGEKYAGFVRLLEGYGQPPLSVGGYCPAKYVNAPMRLLYQAGAISFVVLGIALGVAAWLSRSISSPFRRVSQGVTKIGKFDLNDVQEMQPSRIQEVNDLASSFNRMLWALRSLSTYVPHKLANQVVKGVVGASVVSEERELTVMFTDIVGFTSLSEGMDATEVADFINEHLTLLAECVESTGGTIDKYIGDALMAFWGAPEQLDNTAASACEAARQMSERLRESNRQSLSVDKPSISLRIGIHTGPLVVGNIGAPGRINYTVVGDTVNVAQRLEALGKQVDAEAEVIVLVSADTACHLSENFELRSEGDFQLRGKQQDVGVLRLVV